MLHGSVGQRGAGLPGLSRPKERCRRVISQAGVVFTRGPGIGTPLHVIYRCEARTVGMPAHINGEPKAIEGPTDVSDKRFVDHRPRATLSARDLTDRAVSQIREKVLMFLRQLGDGATEISAQIADLERRRGARPQTSLIGKDVREPVSCLPLLVDGGLVEGHRDREAVLELTRRVLRDQVCRGVADHPRDEAGMATTRCGLNRERRRQSCRRSSWPDIVSIEADRTGAACQLGGSAARKTIGKGREVGPTRGGGHALLLDLTRRSVLVLRDYPDAKDRSVGFQTPGA